MADRPEAITIHSGETRSALGRWVERVTPGGKEGQDLRREAWALSQLRDWERRGGRVIDLGKLERTGVAGYLVHGEDFGVWVHEDGEPPDGRDPKRDAVGITDNHGLRWYSPASDDKGRPITLDDLVAGEKRRAQLATAQRRERERELARARKQARPVTADALEPGEAMTLRAAGERVRNAGGTLAVHEGRLVVSLPASAFGLYSEGVKRAARRLYLAEPEVVRCLKAKSELPDRKILPTGALAPE